MQLQFAVSCNEAYYLSKATSVQSQQVRSYTPEGLHSVSRFTNLADGECLESGGSDGRL